MKITAAIIVLLVGALEARAQEINDLIPNDTITTESVPVTSGNIGPAPVEQIDISKLVVDNSHGTDFNVIVPGHLTLEQQKTLHEKQLAYMMKIKQIPVQAVRNLRTARFVSGTSEIEIYRLTIAFHTRAIEENLPLSAYIDWINAGHPNAKRWIKDAVNCGSHFLVYQDSNICSEFYTIGQYAENYYHAKKNVSQLSAFGAYLIELLSVQGD